MMVINEIFLPDIETIELLVEETRKVSYKKELQDTTDIYHDFLLECYEADKKLQGMVSKEIAEDLICFTIIPINDDENLSSFSFSLASFEDRKIKKREEVHFRNLCDICFGYIKPYYDRLVDYYEEP